MPVRIVSATDFYCRAPHYASFFQRLAPRSSPQTFVLQQKYIIQTGGRICHDSLKPAWGPSLNLAAVLTHIRLVLEEANPDNGLLAEIVSFAILVCLHLATNFLLSEPHDYTSVETI